MAEQYFHLGDILSITTGHLVSPTGMDGIYHILNYMTGSSLFTHQLPRAIDCCAPVLVQRYPHLDGIHLAEEIACLQAQLRDVTKKNDAQAVVDHWLTGLTALHGTELPVPTVPALATAFTTPGADLVERMGADRVIIVEIDKH